MVECAIGPLAPARGEEAPKASRPLTRLSPRALRSCRAAAGVQESLRDEKKPSHNSNMGRVPMKVKQGARPTAHQPESKMAAGQSSQMFTVTRLAVV